MRLRVSFRGMSTKPFAGSSPRGLHRRDQQDWSAAQLEPRAHLSFLLDAVSYSMLMLPEL